MGLDFDLLFLLGFFEKTDLFFIFGNAIFKGDFAIIFS